MGLIGYSGRTIQSLTFPLTATGLSTMACIPRIADWGGLIIGVPIIEPNTPPLEMVKVPPSMSSIASSFVRAWEETKPGQRNLVGSTIVKWYAELSQMDTYCCFWGCPSRTDLAVFTSWVPKYFLHCVITSTFWFYQLISRFCSIFYQCNPLEKSP